MFGRLESISICCGGGDGSFLLISAAPWSVVVLDSDDFCTDDEDDELPLVEDWSTVVVDSFLLSGSDSKSSGNVVAFSSSNKSDKLDRDALDDCAEVSINCLYGCGLEEKGL